MILASVAFVGGRLVLSARPIRDPIVARLVERPVLGLYSLAMAAALARMILAFNAAPYYEVWFASTSVRHLSLSLMLPVCIFLMASLTPKSPTFATAHPPAVSGGPRGIFRITRHPMMRGIGVWALLGPILIDKRRARLLGADRDAFAT